MGCNELIGRFAPLQFSNPCKQLSIQAVNTYSRPEVRIVYAKRILGAQFTDIGQLIVFIDIQASGAVHIVPLGFKISIGIENLDPVILPIGDINIPLFVRTNTVDEIEFSRTAAGRTP